jgi:hypothetical protein
MGNLATGIWVMWELSHREEHAFCDLMVEDYRPADRPDEIFIRRPKNEGGSAWYPLFYKGRDLFPGLRPRLDAVKAEERRVCCFIEITFTRRRALTSHGMIQAAGL